jgi:glycosyltransferase involved in cell wall biosynthesis
MRIAYLSASILPSRTANSIHVMRMCAAYAGLGHEVVLFAPNRSRETEPSQQSLHAYYGVPESFRVETLPWPKVRFKSLAYAYCLGGAVRNFRPDLIHSRFLPGSAAASAPVSLFESHAPVEEDSRAMGRLLRCACLTRRIDGLVVISRALAARSAHMVGGNAGRIMVAPDAADGIPAGTEPSELPGRPGRLRVGYLGQLYEGKGVEVISALAPLAPEADFHIVGGSEKDLAFWRERIRSTNVHFHGFVPPHRAAAYITAFDVCLLPNQKVVRSHTARARDTGDIGAYTSPLKLFEYLAAGKPIIASRLPVLMEILDERIAMLADPSDPGEWLAALRKLSDPALRARLGTAARNEFLAKYSWRTRAADIIAFAARLAAREPGIRRMGMTEPMGKGSAP